MKKNEIIYLLKFRCSSELSKGNSHKFLLDTCFGQIQILNDKVLTEVHTIASYSFISISDDMQGTLICMSCSKTLKGFLLFRTVAYSTFFLRLVFVEFSIALFFACQSSMHASQTEAPAFVLRCANTFFHRGQIYFIVQTNTFCNVDKYIAACTLRRQRHQPSCCAAHRRLLPQSTKPPKQLRFK